MLTLTLTLTTYDSTFNNSYYLVVAHNSHQIFYAKIKIIERIGCLHELCVADLSILFGSEAHACTAQIQRSAAREFVSRAPLSWLRLPYLLKFFLSVSKYNLHFFFSCFNNGYPSRLRQFVPTSYISRPRHVASRINVPVTLKIYLARAPACHMHQ